MTWDFSTYLPRESLVHRMDARVKITLLFVYSFGIFWVDTWVGLLGYALMFLVAFRASRLPLRPLVAMIVPLYIILAFTWAFNAFGTDPTLQTGGYGYGVSPATAGPFAAFPPVLLVGSLYLFPGGCVIGLFIVIRILLLTLASFIVAYSTPSARLAQAVGAMLSPLRRLKVPVDDVSMVLSLALRFIPLIAQETHAVRLAQQSRGGRFDSGSFWKRLKAWGAVFVPVLVGLFRRAERTGLAFDARCYGAVEQRSVLEPFDLSRRDALILACSCLLAAVIAAAL